VLPVVKESLVACWLAAGGSGDQQTAFCFVAERPGAAAADGWGEGRFGSSLFAFGKSRRELAQQRERENVMTSIRQQNKQQTYTQTHVLSWFDTYSSRPE
jgi:hypothetical protein